MKYNQDLGEKWIIMRIYADCPPTTLCGKTLPVVVQSQAWPSSQAIHVIRNLGFGQFLTFENCPTWTPHTSVPDHSHLNLMRLPSLWLEVRAQCYFIVILFYALFQIANTRFQIPFAWQLQREDTTLSNFKSQQQLG